MMKKQRKLSALSYSGNIFSDFSIDNTNYRNMTTNDGNIQQIGVLNIYNETPPLNI